MQSYWQPSIPHLYLFARALCGGRFHPICIAKLIPLETFNCPRCNVYFYGAWMAQFGCSFITTMVTKVMSIETPLLDDMNIVLIDKFF
jgi:hypothetical protein